MRGALFLSIVLFGHGAVALTCLEELYKIHMETPSALRDASSLLRFFEYKNSARATPETIDLTKRCLDDVCVQLEAAAGKKTKSANFGAPSLYEYEVLRLKAGDTVVFGNKKFRLGKFLGMGNTTHIFRLEDDPEWAIRIPLASMLASPRVNADDRSSKSLQLARHENHFAWGKAWVEDAKDAENVVPVREADDEGRYIIVRYIPDGQLGSDYLTEVDVRSVAADRDQFRDFPLWSDPKFFRLMMFLDLKAGSDTFGFERKTFFDANRYMWGNIGGGLQWYNIDPE